MCYRIGRSTASNILRETCWALHHVLDPLYRPVSMSVLLLCPDLTSHSVRSFSSVYSWGGLLVHVKHNGALLMSVQASPKSTLKLKHLLWTDTSTVNFSTLVVFVTVFSSYSVNVASEGQCMTIVAHLSAAGAVLDRCCDSCADVSYPSASLCMPWQCVRISCNNCNMLPEICKCLECAARCIASSAERFNIVCLVVWAILVLHFVATCTSWIQLASFSSLPTAFSARTAKL